jgi:hypothetical protein
MSVQPGEKDFLEDMLHQIVVLDTQGPLLYIGTLDHVSSSVVALSEADVHHAHDSRSTKDFYLVQTRDLGVKVNRSRVYITRSEIAGFSLLSEVRD